MRVGSIGSLVAALAIVVGVAALLVFSFRSDGADSSGSPGPLDTSAPDAPITSTRQGASAPTTTATTATAGMEALQPNAVVIRVVDGDTIDVDIDGRRESVRLIGIDTPEKPGGFREAECFGDEATARVEELLAPGEPVYLERDEELYDRFDRVLAYVHRTSDSLFVNHQLVLEGFAEAFRFEPNTFHANLFENAEADARSADRGLWAACGSADVPLG